jgi:hypothetical protein
VELGEVVEERVEDAELMLVDKPVLVDEPVLVEEPVCVVVKVDPIEAVVGVTTKLVVYRVDSP